MNFVLDSGQVQVIVRQLLDAVPSGSYLVISHPTTEVDAEPMIQAAQFWNQQGSAQMTLRTREEIVRFFDGTDLVKPTHFCGVARRNAPS